MVSKYFERKTATKEFQNRLENILSGLTDKRVIIYGAGQGFLFFEKNYKITERLNIVGISDKKFKGNFDEKYCNIKTLSIEQLKKQDYDYILVCNEAYNKIISFLTNEMSLNENKIISIFEECIKDEAENVNYLYKMGFDKTLPKLIKKLKNKKVVFYGAGVFLETIKKYFNISEIDVIGISDKKYEHNTKEEFFQEYKIILPEEIQKLRPDYVIITTKFYIKLINNLENGILKNAGIKIIPLVNKPFCTLYKEFKKQ